MNNPQTYLERSFATLDKHAASGQFNTSAALRLLRRNARDVLPSNATYVEQMAQARKYLAQWRARATVAQSTN